MSATSTQTYGKGIANFAVGSYIDTGTAAAIVITCGFKPRYIRVENETSRDGYQWFEGMADAEAIKWVAAGTRTIITTLGITPSASGFTIGLDTDVNVTSEQISWMAIG